MQRVTKYNNIIECGTSSSAAQDSFGLHLIKIGGKRAINGF